MGLFAFIFILRKVYFQSPPFFLGLLVAMAESGRLAENPMDAVIFISIYIGLGVLASLSILLVIYLDNVFDIISKSMSLYGLQHYMSLSESWHENRSSGEKLQRILSARQFSYEFLELFFWQLLNIPAIVIMILATILALNAPPYLIILYFLYLLTYIFGSYITGNWLKPRYEDYNASLEKTIGKSYEFLNSTATVRLFNLRRHIMDKAGRYERKNFLSRQRLHQTDNRRWVIVNLIALFWLAVIISLCTYHVIDGSMSVSAYSAAIFLAVMMWIQMEVFALIYGNLIKQWEGVRRLTEILNLTPKIRNKPNAVDLERKSAPLVFENVSFHYHEEKKVIDNINLHLAPGEKIGLIGESGAGKSTIVKLLMRFYDVQGGSIKIGGHDIRDLTLASLHEHIAVIPQDVVLFNHSIMENIRYGNVSASDDAVIAAARQAHADDFIRDLPDGYETQVGERGLKLSGGQKQRIAIARAILKDAPILVLDEATSALDSESEKLIQESLSHLMKGKAVIAIAHRLSTVFSMDKLVVMDHGQIAEHGTHDELLASGGRYAKLWNLQSGGFLGA